jgi:Helix-turn-helix
MFAPTSSSIGVGGFDDLAVAARSDRTFGRMSKEWRGRRGYSQLGLALAARTTQRHLSFIESGRAAPGRDILRLRARKSLAGI